MRRRRNPGPLIAAVAAFPWLGTLIGTSLLSVGLFLRGQEQAEYEEYKAQVQPPRPPPAPPAPQTREELTRWTPADLERQARLEWERWRREAIPEAPPPPAKEPDLWLWLGAGAAVLGLILAVKG